MMMRVSVVVAILLVMACGDTWDSETHWDERNAEFELTEDEGLQIEMIDEATLLGDDLWHIAPIKEWSGPVDGEIWFDARSCDMSSPSPTNGEIPAALIEECGGD
jgi:hypothetical protein